MGTQTKTLIITVILSILIKFSVSGQTYSNTTIYTPIGTPVTAKILTAGEMTAYWKNYLKEYWLDYYDDRIYFLAEATWTYNCHAYAWWISEGGSTVWLNSPGDDEFWEDGSYIEVSSQSEATKISFGGPCWYTHPDFGYGNWCDHSAITTGTQDLFISKWGASPRFRNDVDDCPYDDQDLHYYAQPAISGDDIICNPSSNTYSVQDFYDVTYSWITSSNLQINGPSTSRTVSISPTSSSYGYGYITVSIYIPTYDKTRELTKTVWIGVPTIPTTNPFGTPPIEMGKWEYLDIMISYAQGADPSTGAWSSNMWIYTSESEGQYGQFFSFTETEDAEFYVTTSNECGVSPTRVGYIHVGDYHGKAAQEDEFPWTIIPNPATSYIDINLQSEKDELIGDYPVEIIDSNSRIVREAKLKGNSGRIDVADLSVGYYIVKLTVNGKVYQKVLIIQK